MLTFLFEANIFAKTIETYNLKRWPRSLQLLNTYHSSLLRQRVINQHIGITKIAEHLDETQAGSYVLAGVFIFDYTLFDVLKETQGNMQKAFERIVQQQGLFGSIFEHEWIDLGYPWNVLDANRFLMKSYRHATIASSVKFDGNVMINGPVQIMEDVVIGGGSIINGPCYIGRGTYIGNNVLVRKNTSIGAESIIGFGVELRN